MTHSTSANGLLRRAFAAESGALVLLGAVADALPLLPVADAEADLAVLVRFPLGEAVVGWRTVVLWKVRFDEAVMVACCVAVELAMVAIRVVLVAAPVLLLASDEVVDADSDLDLEAEDALLAELDAELDAEEDDVAEDEMENSGVKLTPPDASVI